MQLPRTIRILCSNRFLRLGLCLSGIGACHLFGQVAPSSAERIADALLQSGPGTVTSWSEDTGLELEGLNATWYNTAKGSYYRYARTRADAVLAANPQTGAIDTDESALLGRELLLLYRVTLDPKYYKAAAAIRAQLAASCDTVSPPAGSLCTAGPFLAEYASVFQEPQEFANITRDFERWDREAHWPSKTEEQESTDRSIAWLAASLVDALPSYPQDDAERAELIAILNKIAKTAAAHQSTSAGFLLSASRRSPEASLLAYALAKGARLGYLPAHDSVVAADAGRANRAVDDKEKNPASGARLLASAELDLAPTATLAGGQTVLLDAWYNSQQRKNAAGQQEYFHYKWSDESDSGYALLGHIFHSYGAATDTLYSAPTRTSLSKAQYYIIVSPDIPVKNPNPHYMNEEDANEIAAWVKDGGVLILMENDPPNADLAHLNLLADKFGLHFDDVLHHHILGDHVDDGRMPVEGNGPLFHHPHTLYMKDTCAISLTGSAGALFRDRGDVVMAAAKYGRGTVFAAVDPWIYNEYADGRKNPAVYDQFDNFAGGRELVQWLLQQHPH